MKKIVCEMCGSSNVTKKGEVFVCADCGMQYDTEAAKALMVEVTGKVDVTGSTVTVDNSEEVKNLLEIARRSLSESNYQNAEKYFEMLLVKDANNWEASFYSAYCQAMQGKIGEILKNALLVKNSSVNAFNLILKNPDVEEQKKELKKMVASAENAAIVFHSNAYSFFQQFVGKGTASMAAKTREEYISRKFAAVNIYFTLAENIERIYKDHPDMVKFSIELYKKGLAMNQKKGMLDYYANFKQEYILGIVEKVKAAEPEFEYKYKPNGCYVATCVYGSYDCPQVWTLRRYRDNTLAATWYGRLFIKFYYAVSPTVVKLFGKTKWFNKIWKKRLEKMVAKLNANGVEDTPYEDINWR